jgi:small acid-soluble spore protein H (minor)
LNENLISYKEYKYHLLGVKIMNVNRVRQILSSSADIEVKYNGASVWIDQLNEDGRTATVHLRGPLEERSNVEINELVEE